MCDRDRSRTIAHAWFLRESTETGDIDFCKVEIVSDLDPTLQGHGMLNISCFWTGHNVGQHDETPHDGAPPAHRDIVIYSFCKNFHFL